MRGETTQTKGKRSLKVLIILLSLSAAISTDMCLPALPTIAAHFNESSLTTNLIIVTFFLFMALSMLALGPASDRFGRRRVLIISLSVFLAANIACALSPNIWMLVVARSLAACGAGGMMTASTALVKDAFSGRDRIRVLALVQTFGVIGPLVAPIVGAAVLTITSWRVSFLILAVVGLAELALALCEKNIKSEGSEEILTIRETALHMKEILSHKGIVLILLFAGLLSACMMAYLATSSYIYIEQFGIGETAYSLFFSATALGSMAGPRIYLALQTRIATKKIAAGCALVVLFVGVLILVFGHLSPWAFFLCFFAVPLTNSVSRPMVTELLFRQHEGGTGTLSSVINFGLSIIGLLGMVTGSLSWPDFILALGILIVFFSCASLAALIILLKSNIHIKGLETKPE